MTCIRLAMVALLAACAGSPIDEAVADGPPSSPPPSCGDAESYGGGEWLSANGAELWYSVRGPADAPTVVFLHGGPGYNGYAFERAVGERLAQRVRLVILDQRGCGRSANGAAELDFGLSPTLADVEALRRSLDIQRWTVLGHSFGGLLAAAYAHRYPGATTGVVLVETTPSMPRALEHQIQTAAAAANERWPSHADAIGALANGDAPPFERLMSLYGLTGRESLQALLHWADPANQARADRWDAESGLLACTRPSVLEAYRAEGLLDGTLDWLSRPLPRPGVLIGGERSEVIGDAELARAAEVWGVRRVSLTESGHFPYVEEPDAFATAVWDAVATFAP